MISILSGLTLVLASLMQPPADRLRLVWKMVAREDREKSGKGFIYKFMVHHVDRDHARAWFETCRIAREAGQTVEINLLDGIEGMVPYLNEDAADLAASQFVTLSVAGIGTSTHLPWVTGWMNKMSKFQPEFEGMPSKAVIEIVPGSSYANILVRFPWRPGLKDRSWHGYFPIQIWENILEVVGG